MVLVWDMKVIILVQKQKKNKSKIGSKELNNLQDHQTSIL